MYFTYTFQTCAETAAFTEMLINVQRASTKIKPNNVKVKRRGREEKREAERQTDGLWEAAAGRTEKDVLRD